eukprot:g16120.t1
MASGTEWRLEDTRTNRVFENLDDTALHPVDIVLEWTFNSGVALSQPVITCADTSASKPTSCGWGTRIFTRDMGGPTCTRVTVAGVGDMDGTYEYEPAYTNPEYIRTDAMGAVSYALYKDTYKPRNWEIWYIREAGSWDLVYMTYDVAVHRVGTRWNWVQCDCMVTRCCDTEASLLQPVILCEGDALPSTIPDRKSGPSAYPRSNP